MSYETTDKEIFSAKSRSSYIPLREPAESDPVVTTLYDIQRSHGSRVALTVEYEASSAVDIMWRRNGSNYVCFDRLRRTGQTSMVIKKADVGLHNNNRYTVIITDGNGRKCSSSARVFVHY